MFDTIISIAILIILSIIDIILVIANEIFDDDYKREIRDTLDKVNTKY